MAIEEPGKIYVISKTTKRDNTKVPFGAAMVEPGKIDAAIAILSFFFLKQQQRDNASILIGVAIEEPEKIDVAIAVLASFPVK